MLRALLLCLLALGVAQAAPTEDDIPADLVPWVPWVLAGEPALDCPLLQRAGARICAWPGSLELNLDRSEGRFAQSWKVYAESWIGLPGNSEVWPQDVTADGIAVPVLQHDGVPAVKLDAGEYRLEGRFAWSQRPRSLQIPPTTALIGLVLDGESIARPRRDAGGRLWLGPGAEPSIATPEDTLSLEVFRRIDDDIPMRVQTRIEVDASGSAREVTIGPVLLADGLPLALTSLLPARLEPDGMLRLQVRPGRWQIEITGYHPRPVEALRRQPATDPWPEHEVWSFAARPSLRIVDITGPTPIDPRQADVPTAWSDLPAYLVASEEAMRMALVERGDARPSPDRLTLERELWLDFDGVGYSLRDRIEGQLIRSWRIESSDAIELGRVEVDGQPRLITQLDADVGLGVEVRRGSIELLADSRIENATDRLPASGWALDFQSQSMRLNLPPGWDVLAVSGVDNQPSTWANNWNLLDLFWVLVVALAVARLWNRWWGLIALVTMVLIWHRPDAPTLIWLHILAAVALMRVLPSVPERAVMARLRMIVKFYYRASLVVLALIGLPFMVQEVRDGLYPQLDRPQTSIASLSHATVTDQVSPKREIASSLPPGAPPTRLTAIDPDARIQTGPGMPAWRRLALHLDFNGPVARDHQIRLWLVSPTWNLALAVISSSLVLLLGLHLAGLTRARRAILAGALVVGVFGAGPAAADAFPPQEMLSELKARLTEPPDCLPDCADIARLQLRARPDHLDMRLDVSAAVAVALEIPGGAGFWTPTTLTLGDEPLEPVRQDAEGTYSIPVPPGHWTIDLSGPLPPRSPVDIAIPLRPHRIDYQLSGWRLDGIGANGRPGAQIQLVRLRDELPDGQLQPADLPPLIRVERTLSLGMQWNVETRVVRLSPPQPPLLIRVPLIDGERVLSDGFTVKDQGLLVGLVPGQRETRWTSALDPVDELTLRAPEETRITEVWRIDPSPRWHLRFAGIPPVQATRIEDRLVAWRPWPGESVRLTIAKPAAVSGATLTRDATRYRITPGQRTSHVELELVLRSSQGGWHEIQLPEGSALERVLVDGEERPLRLEEGGLRLPLSPTAETFTIAWRQDAPMSRYFTTPITDIGIPGVNTEIQINLGHGRWVLFTGGPAMGPAVRFWGLLAVLVVVAVLLGRSRLTPLNAFDWLLLALGLSQAGIGFGLLVTAWFFALGLRARYGVQNANWRFNLIQVGIGILTLLAASALIGAVRQGLLGLPEMQIAGNGSNGSVLNWYEDRSGTHTPSTWVVSVPLLVYRGLMLAWALWLAVRLLDWVRWGWACYSTPLLWRETKIQTDDAKLVTEPTVPTGRSEPSA